VDRTLQNIVAQHRRDQPTIQRQGQRIFGRQFIILSVHIARMRCVSGGGMHRLLGPVLACLFGAGMQPGLQGQVAVPQGDGLFLEGRAIPGGAEKLAGVG